MAKRVPVSVDRNSSVPMYQQLADQLRAAIASGALRPGDAVENEVTLADRLGVARPTVRRALGDLVGGGLLVRKRGVGTVVAYHLNHCHDQLNSLNDDLRRVGRAPTTKLIEFDTSTTDERAAAVLGLPARTRLVLVQRVRSAQGVPLAVLTNWLPPQYADLTVEELETDGLYQILRSRGVTPVVGHQVISARTSTSRERELLGMSRSEPLLTMSRDAYDRDGRPVEFGVHCYRADQYSFEFTARNDHWS